MRSLEDNKLGFKYQYVLEETQGKGRRERDVPDAAKERREVQVGYKINAFGHVDTAVSTFYCDFKIFAWWKDRKLMGEQPKAVDWKRAGLFNPELTIANDHNLQ